MGSPRRQLLVALCALAGATLAPCAHADAPRVQRPPLTWAPAAGNYRPATRPLRSIRYVVIHATEGPLLGTVSWFEDRKARVSAHYVVGRDGSIVQLVPLRAIAWHTGNAYYNAHSVGIENVGITDDPAGFTPAEYRASARLAAWLCRRSLIPIDRAHVIGHDEVPDPAHPGLFGGADHHTDPGRYWNWTLFMQLVRRYAYPQPPLRVASATLYDGQTVTGKVPWRAATKGPVSEVEFLVDGKRLWVDRSAPYALGFRGEWNTLGLANGRHRLELVARGAHGAVARRTLVVRVRNRPFALTLAGLRPGRMLKGVARFGADAVGTPLASIRLYVDGRLHETAARKPYRFALDTRRLVDGVHTLDLRARSFDNRTTRRRLRVVVRNTPPPRVVGQSLADGQTLQGTADWQVFVKRPVERVDFLVDGTLVGSTTRIPYAFAWDTGAVAPGPHTLVARVVGRGGTVSTPPLAVTVAPAPAAATATTTTGAP